MLHKGVIGMAVIAGVLLVAASVSTARPAGDAAAGKEVFLKKCKSCHGEDGKGNQGMAKLLKTTIAPLDSSEIQGKSDAELKKVITEGKEKMKPVTGLSEADITNVIAFVRTFKKK
jgi:mono/diheme cytochrome c family protein